MYLIYFFYFAAEGIIYPFWPTWLKSLGYSNGEIGIFMSAAYWPQVFIGLGLTHLADWRFRPLRLAGGAAVLSSLCVILFYLPQNFWLFLSLAILYGGLWTVVLPLCEAYLLAREKTSSQDYGRVRALGSTAFIISSLVGGWMIAATSQRLVPALIAAFMVATAVICFALSAEKPAPKAAPPLRQKTHLSWRLLSAHGALLGCLIAAGFIQLSHSLYFTTASNDWARIGYSSSWIGLFWAIAVLAEIVYFAVSGTILGKVAPLVIMIISGLCAAFRWSLPLIGDGLALIIIAQMFHALSFAAYHSALMRFIRDHAPETRRNLIQGFYYSFIVAIPMGIMTPVSGHLFDVMANQAYGLMIVFALCGAGVAGLTWARLVRS